MYLTFSAWRDLTKISAPLSSGECSDAFEWSDFDAAEAADIASDLSAVLISMMDPLRKPL
jgi:hypothetical protein